ncbi:ABC transporter permease [Paenibacillus xanthanilyticus]|uniref:ABC transporter permease n=1 Tax=Paenibacillus xanthanilyticus TaxID=1783531 RepID=A0ABV8K0X6_9BACL
MRTRYLWAAMIVLSICSVFIGVNDLSPLDLFHLTDAQEQVLFVSRIPRLVSLLIAGVSMSVIGLIMQQLSRNKFVSPSTAGTMDSASLGLLMAILILPAATPLQKIAFAFLFALAGTFVFMKILDRVKLKDTIFIPLVGMMFGGVISSVTTFFAYKHDLLQTLGSWLNGDFSMILKGRYEMLYLSIPLVILAYVFANKFTVAGMGEEFAVNLGLRYSRVVNIGLILVSLVCAVVILTVGTIPFLGLIIPNIVTIYQGDHLKKNLPHTALLGAVFLLFCDILGRVVLYPYEVSIGLTVGVIGSGIFLYLLMRRKTYGL